MYRDEKREDLFKKDTLEVKQELIIKKVKDTVNEFYDSIPGKVNEILGEAIYSFLGIKKDRHWDRVEIIEKGPLYKAIQTKVQSVLDKVVDAYVDQALELLRTDKKIHTKLNEQIKDTYRRALDHQMYERIGMMAEADGCKAAEELIEQLRKTIKLGSIHKIELEDPNSTPDGELGDSMLADIVQTVLSEKESK